MESWRVAGELAPREPIGWCMASLSESVIIRASERKVSTIACMFADLLVRLVEVEFWVFAPTISNAQQPTGDTVTKDYCR